MSEKELQQSSCTDTKLTPSASRRDFLIGTGALAAGSVTSGQVAADPSSNFSNRVVAYLFGLNSNNYGPADIPYNKITHLNYAFLEPQSDGTVILDDNSTNAAEEDTILSELGTYNDSSTTFCLSISDGWYPQTFSDAASTQENRQRFAQTAVDHVVNYGFDGIDLDWEFPDGDTDPQDPDNFELLIEEVEAELESRVGSRAHLSIAASTNTNIAADAYKDSIFDNLDGVNVMAYNYHGGWSNDTNFNAPLYSPPEDPDGHQDFNIDNSMQYWDGRPVANEKLTMGLPFYGRSYSGVPDQNDGLFQSFDSETALLYEDIVNNKKSDPNYTYFMHPDAEVPWLYSAADNNFISYDDEMSHSTKLAYVKDNGFGGAMVWALSHDSSNFLISEIHDQLHGTPSVTWEHPYSGQEVDRDVPIEIAASDETDSTSDLTVEWQVDNGTWKATTFNSNTGNFEATWDARSFADGEHRLDARATDTGGNTSSDRHALVIVNNPPAGTPYIDKFQLTDNGGGPAWVDYTCDWAVSDDEGDLSEVKSEIIDSTGAVQGSTSSSVSGSTASGTHDLRVSEGSEWVLTVFDSAGHSYSDSKPVSE